MKSKAVAPKAVVAALFGTVVGGTAGVWSLPRPAAIANAAAPVGAAAPVVLHPPPVPVASVPEPTRARTNPARSVAEHPVVPAAPAGAPAPSADDDGLVLERARMLARRPDVLGLMALRDTVFRRATEGGIADSASVKRDLDELDRRLHEARAAQLKLDGEAFRTAASKRP